MAVQEEHLHFFFKFTLLDTLKLQLCITVLKPSDILIGCEFMVSLSIFFQPVWKV